MATDSKQIAQDVLTAVGGPDNVISATYCMTRLRMRLQDDSLPNDDQVRAIDGVLGIQRAGGFYQVVIGQTVGQVYDEFCPIANIPNTGGLYNRSAAAEDVAVDNAPKQKLTLKTIGTSIIDYVSGAMGPMLPALMVAGFFNLTYVIFGPTMLGWIPEGSDTAFFLTLIYNTGMYYLPVFLGYTAAKKLGIDPVLGLLMACILISPSFMAMAQNGESFSILGMPVTALNYSQSVLPILLSVAVLAPIYKFLDKHTPAIVRGIVVPFASMLITVPIALLVLCPIGNNVGNAMGDAMYALGTAGGLVTVIALTVYTALSPFLVSTGMHMAVAMIGIATLGMTGSESFALVGNNLSNFSVWAIALGYALREKNAEKRGDYLGYFVSGFAGGVIEPTLFGVCWTYPRAFIGVICGGAVSGFIGALFSVNFHVMGSSSILCLLNFVSPNGPVNLIGAIIAGAAGFVVSLVTTMALGYEKSATDTDQNA